MSGRTMRAVVGATLDHAQFKLSLEGNHGRPLRWPTLTWALRLACGHEQRRAVQRVFGMERTVVALPPRRVRCLECVTPAGGAP